MKENDTIVVFTARSPDRIVKEGGSQAWVLNPSKAKLAKWLVCTQNRHHPDHMFSDATEPHGAAFLVGKISGITKSLEENNKERWLVEISEFARISKPDAWRGRNPVHYTSLSELGIKVGDLKFEPISSAKQMPTTLESKAPWPPATLTIAEAKKALAATFGVKPEAVEISIRG